MVTKGVEMKNEIGSMIRAGGKIQMHPESLKYATKI